VNRPRLLAAVALPAALALMAAYPVLRGAVPAQAATGRPTTIPALQSWTPATGSYRFTSASRIVVDSSYAGQLSTTASVFADDLGRLLGRTPVVVNGSASGLASGDILLSLVPTDTSLGAEGYRMVVGSSVTVQARFDAGDFYGTRTLLQLLRQSRTIAAGTALDRPAYRERGLMVDAGRKYFTIGWLREHVKELAYLKLNYFHLHLSDNLGFRLESATHPEIVSAQHYTKQEITDLVALAARYHVTVVPEIDMPGHMDQILASHPELKLVSSTGKVNNGYVDLSKAGAYSLMQDLINEYLPLFPARYWHLGADEYVTDYSSYPQLLAYAQAHYGSAATPKDTYYGFINWADGLVRAKGRTLRAWNDGIAAGDGTVKPAADIVVDDWYNKGLTPQQLVDAGHLVMNSSYRPTYYVVGHSVKPDSATMYQTWTPNVFQGGATLSAASVSRNLGAKLHVWCDSPNAETEQQVAGGIRDPLRVMAQQTWGTPKLVPSYADFQGVIARVGRSPGWAYDTAAGDLALNRPATASSVENSDFPAAEAFDGGYGSRWSSAYSDPQWIQVDLGTTRAFGHVKLTWESAYATAYQLQVSADGTQWTTVYTTTSGDGGTDDLTGLSATGRYVRLVGTHRATRFGYSLRELEIFAT
jgi:hexosaminidase